MLLYKQLVHESLPTIINELHTTQSRHYTPKDHLDLTFIFNKLSYMPRSR